LWGKEGCLFSSWTPCGCSCSRWRISARGWGGRQPRLELVLERRSIELVRQYRGRWGIIGVGVGIGTIRRDGFGYGGSAGSAG
jgi:hypothetical protein